MHWMRNLCEHMPHGRLRNERRQIRSSQSRRVPHLQSLRSTVSFRCHSGNRVSSHFYSHFTCCIRRSLLRELRLSYFLHLTHSSLHHGCIDFRNSLFTYSFTVAFFLFASFLRASFIPVAYCSAFLGFSAIEAGRPMFSATFLSTSFLRESVFFSIFNSKGKLKAKSAIAYEAKGKRNSTPWKLQIFTSLSILFS